jgi:3-hydroxyacyl-CoA dehydrogenase
MYRHDRNHTGESMKIGIIGAGNIGSALAGHFCKLQHAVLIANSRGPETLSKVAEATGATPVGISAVVKGSLLERANRKKAADNRDQAAKIMAKLPPDFPAQELVRASRFLVGLDVLKPRSWFAMARLGFAVLRPARS